MHRRNPRPAAPPRRRLRRGPPPTRALLRGVGRYESRGSLRRVSHDRRRRRTRLGHVPSHAACRDRRSAATRPLSLLLHGGRSPPQWTGRCGSSGELIVDDLTRCDACNQEHPGPADEWGVYGGSERLPRHARALALSAVRERRDVAVRIARREDRSGQVPRLSDEQSAEQGQEASGSGAALRHQGARGEEALTRGPRGRGGSAAEGSRGQPPRSARQSPHVDRLPPGSWTILDAVRGETSRASSAALQ